MNHLLNVPHFIFENTNFRLKIEFLLKKQLHGSYKIELQNSAQFQNSGTEGSYILILSQNNSAENGGGEKAIILKNSANGDVLVYAGHGEIELQSSVDLKEVTAYRIRIKNSAQIIYESGLANILFTSGPSGGYSISDWKEIK